LLHLVGNVKLFCIALNCERERKNSCQCVFWAQDHANTDGPIG